MWLLILEAALACGLFVFIVWWTVFSGRRPDTPPDASAQDATLPDVTPPDAKPPDAKRPEGQPPRQP